MVCKRADAYDFTLTPTLSLKGEGEHPSPPLERWGELKRRLPYSGFLILAAASPML